MKASKRTGGLADAVAEGPDGKEMIAMPLSDHERKRLQELEMDLAADDPVLARELATGTRPRLRLLRSAGLVLALVGFALIIVGIAAQLPSLGVLGFLLMFGGACGYLGRLLVGS